MILKERKKPPELQQLTRFMKRLPTEHPRFPEWAEKFRRMNAGFEGERRIDSLWAEADLPTPHYFIHDLYISKEQFPYQLDTVLITSRFILILEIKSISGLLNFDDRLRQFSRTNRDGTTDGMINPDDQIRRHEKWMNKFLAKKAKVIPVIGVVVFTYPSAVIQQKAAGRMMIHSSGLPHLMDQLTRTYKRLLSENEIKTVAESLLAHHTEKQLKRPFSAAAYMTGVLCPNCPAEKLMYANRKWRCRKCAFEDRKAYIEALTDYRLLVGSTITNREFRIFTGLASPSAASRMLKELNMPFSGRFKDRNYHIPERFERNASNNEGSASQ